MNRLEYFEARCEATLSPMEYAAASDRDPDAFFWLMSETLLPRR